MNKKNQENIFIQLHNKKRHYNPNNIFQKILDERHILLEEKNMPQNNANKNNKEEQIDKIIKTYNNKQKRKLEHNEIKKTKDKKITIKNIKQDTTKINEKPKEFDDMLFENMETTDIVMTDPSHIPIGNKPEKIPFHRDIIRNLKDVKYDPEIERKKYDYENVKNIRKTTYKKE